MANDEHVNMLKEGVDEWNSWRKENPEIVPDLKGALLFKIDLYPKRKAPANLSDVDLSHALIMQANLYHANLVGANLTRANLGNTDLTYANIGKAILREAFLGGTNFCYATLSASDMTSAILGGTVFGNTNLNNAIGLESCVHHFPSILDHSTLKKSGKLPLNFLRGCGLPDTLIEFFPSMLNDPIEFYSCFISYSSKDQVFAERLYADLQNKGVRCWFAPEDLKIGDKFRQKIDESIRVHDKLLLILSENSITSSWVEDEVESALEREHRERRPVLFPVRIDEGVMHTNEAWAASLRRNRHIGDFTKWKEHDDYRRAFARLMRDLKASGSKESRA